MERIREMYPAYNRASANHRKLALLEEYGDYDPRVTIVEGKIPMWGSAIDTSPTYGQAESGFQVWLDRSREKVPKKPADEYICHDWRRCGYCPPAP